MQRAFAFKGGALPLETPSVPASTAPTTPTKLWFCAYLPNLPLEASGADGSARVIVEDQRGIHRVLQANSAALAAGVMAGQSSNAALALLPDLIIEERCPLREQQALEQLAAWLETFSSMVNIAGPNLLLLEIAGSLRLYGGLECLRQKLVDGFKQHGMSVSLAIAPTPLTATWLARAGRRVCIRDAANITRALREIPVTCLEWPVATCEALAGMGVKTIGECLRLPRDGFARRFGPQRLLELDRALGRLPDPRTSWRAPERFCADIEMTEEQSNSERLLTICEQLLQSMQRFLVTRQLATQQLRFSFFHLRAPATQLIVGGAGFDHRAEHWLDLLRIRFERVALPEPVIAIRLEGGRHQAMQSGSASLALQGNATRPSRWYSMSQLAERLAARLGRQSIQSVSTVAEHRPHRAWQAQTAAGVVTGWSNRPDSMSRPLWLLPEPAVLTAQGFQLLNGPERLETGWWDNDGIARDYYTALNPHGHHLWVFRDRTRQADAHHWFLHGLFG
ncbi:MAG: DNA polymerase Y family protein [Pseudomonadota bacterium]